MHEPAPVCWGNGKRVHVDKPTGGEVYVAFAFPAAGMLPDEKHARALSRSISGEMHSGYAAIAPSPVWRLVWALNTLKDHNDYILIDHYYDHVRPPGNAELQLLKAMPFDEERRKAALGIDRFINDEHGLDVLKRLYYGPTVTICGIQAGYTGAGMKTVLPNTAFAKLDCRLVPDLTPEICLSLLRAHLDRRGFRDVEVVPLNGEHPG